MSDAEPTPRADGPRADRLGVVDPLRIPGADRVREAWRRMPVLGQLFVALALLDLTARVLHTGGLTLAIDPSYPATLLSAFLPHYPLILLPAVILARRPDARDATPLVMQGAIAVALVELLSEPLFTIVFPQSGPDLTGWILLQVAVTFARAGGYVTIALGLLELITVQPGPALRGLTNLVTGVMAVAALTSVMLLLLFPPSDFGLPGMGGLLLLVGVVAELAGLAFAFLGWSIVRGAVDIRRPMAATFLATSAIAIAAINSLLVLVVNLGVLARAWGGIFAGPVAPVGLGWLGTGLVLTLLVVAFGLGLADTSVRIPRRGTYRPIEAEPEPEPIYWPSPGGEVPAYRPIERPAEPTTSKSVKPSRRRAPKKKESPG